MKCRSCKREIPDNSIFCNWCGEKQIKERKKKTEISVPKPRQLPSGAWTIQLRAEGQSVTEPTAALCTAKARAIRAGFLEAKKAAPNMTVSEMLESYIDKRREVLSPSTIRGYEYIRKMRFAAVMDDEAAAVDWQAAINEDAAKYGAKTVKNAWGLVSAALAASGFDIPRVTLPQIIKKDQPWLDYEQIGEFLSAVEGEACEVAALLALHSLRASELLALTAKDIDLKGGKIKVRGAAVLDENNRLVTKQQNKNATSRRDVPIMIPRLRELLPLAIEEAEGGALISTSPNTLRSQINAVCRRAGLPLVGVHGLRRSFASLAYHLEWSELATMHVGGWADYQTMRDIYTKLAEKDKQAEIKKMSNFYKKTVSKSVSKNEA